MNEMSADPYKLILGIGTSSEKNDILEETDPKHKQVWVIKDSQGRIQDIEQYNALIDDWDSLLGEFAKQVSGISPDDDGNIPQVVEVQGPSPSKDGEEFQWGFDWHRQEIFIHRNGAWRFVGAVGSVEGATHTHSLDPSADQVNDPSSAPDAAETGSSSNVDAGEHKYVITYIADWGETKPSPASNIVDVTYGEVSLTNIPTASEGVVTDRYIYRTKAGGDTFYYLDNIGDNTTTSYTDTTADADLGSDTAPTENTTEAHSGSLPEDYVGFDSGAGHNHDGANSREVVTPDHDIDPSAGGSPHTGKLPWSQLESVPTSFTPEGHDVNPGEGPHTGKLPWSQLESVPDLALSGHGNDDHDPNFATTSHNNDQHSENYITSARERIRYGAGQLGNINSMQNLQPPVPIDVGGEIVKAYVLARVAPDNDVSATITIEDDTHGQYFQQIVTLPSGETKYIDTSIEDTEVNNESIISFSLDDSDPTGKDFGIYLIVDTEIGS